MILAATTDAFVTLAWFGLIIVIGCAAGALGERFLLRQDRKRGLS